MVYIFINYVICYESHNKVRSVRALHRALTPLFENGAEAHGIGKISGVLTKIGKFDGCICSFLGPSLYVSPN